MVSLTAHWIICEKKTPHPSLVWDSCIKAKGEVWWSQPAQHNEYSPASARFSAGDNYGQKTTMAVHKREEERFTNKSCKLPTGAPQGGVLLLIMLCVSSNEARSTAEQWWWRLGWPKVSYIVFTLTVWRNHPQQLCPWNVLRNERKLLGLPVRGLLPT